MWSLRQRCPRRASSCHSNFRIFVHSTLQVRKNKSQQVPDVPASSAPDSSLDRDGFDRAEVCGYCLEVEGRKSRVRSDVHPDLLLIENSSSSHCCLNGRRLLSVLSWSCKEGEAGGNWGKNDWGFWVIWGPPSARGEPRQGG